LNTFLCFYKEKKKMWGGGGGRSQERDELLAKYRKGHARDN